MSIKAGQILHDANGFVVDRIQTGGVSNLNIPEEKIYELGNYQTVATVRDIPDLSFDLESLDVSTEIEALTLGIDPTTTVAGQEFDFTDSLPMDVISPFKSAQGAFNIVKGIAVPYLNLEQVNYRFGTRANATQRFTYRGDSVFYVPGTPYVEEFAGDSIAVAFNYANTALAYEDAGVDVFILNASIYHADGTCTRLFRGDDFTDTSTVITTTVAVATGATLRIVYGSATAATYAQTVHQGTSVKPAAVRGKDIDVYVETVSAGGTLARWTGVTAFDVSRRVSLENDEEFGNDRYVAQDYNTADVTGTVTLRPATPTDLFDKIRQVGNVDVGKIIGTFTSATFKVELRINDPDTGARLKTLYIPDARFTVPAINGRANQKLDTTFNFTSDGGTLLVYKGARP